MFPQHVVKCCDRPSHMREEDCWLVSGFRKGVDADVAEELEEKVVGGHGVSLYNRFNLYFLPVSL